MGNVPKKIWKQQSQWHSPKINIKIFRDKLSDQRQKQKSQSSSGAPTRLPSVSACHTEWHIMRRQSESSLPVTQLCFTCEYPACIRWLWVGEPRAKLLLYAQLCRRTVFTRHPRAHITSAQAINTESRTINPDTHCMCVCVQTGDNNTLSHRKIYIFLNVCVLAFTCTHQG